MSRRSAPARGWETWQRRPVLAAYAIATLFIIIDRWALTLALSASNIVFTSATLFGLCLFQIAAPIGLLAAPIGVCFLIGLAASVNLSRRYFLAGAINGALLSLNLAFIHLLLLSLREL